LSPMMPSSYIGAWAAPMASGLLSRIRIV
jgi:hypothetical protein